MERNFMVRMHAHIKIARSFTVHSYNILHHKQYHCFTTCTKNYLIANDGLKVQVITCNEIQIKKHVEIEKCYKISWNLNDCLDFFVFSILTHFLHWRRIKLDSMPQNQFTHIWRATHKLCWSQSLGWSINVINSSQRSCDFSWLYWMA